MAAKKTKEGGDNFWRTSIENGVLDSETWQVKVIIIEAAGSDLDRSYMTRFEEFALEEKRCVIKNICKTETMFMINQLGGEKRVKEPKYRVFEEAMVFVREKMDIPTEHMALVIKHLILDMKEEYLTIKREKLQVKLGIDKEMVNIENKAEYRGMPQAPPPPPSDTEKEKKGKKKDERPELEPVEGKKYSTQLRERGEEWRDKLYVDDYPIDGPNIYVAVTSFLDKDLAVELIKIAVPVVTVLQIRIDPLTVKVPQALLRSTKRNLSQSEDLTNKAFKFWNDTLEERVNEPTASLLKNCAFILYSPPYAGDANLSADPETIYDELSCLMYDIHDMTRQHSHYLANMNVVSVPSETSANPSLEHLYNNIVAYYPLECVTLYSVIDAMLRSVVRVGKGSLTDDEDVTFDDNKHIDDLTKTEKATNFVRDIFKTLTVGEDTKKTYRLTYGEEFDKEKDPIVIQYGDIAKQTTFQLGVNLNRIVNSCLLGMPFNKLWEGLERSSDKLEAKINFHVNVLLSCFDRKDIETSELNRMIHLLACRKLHNNRSSLHKEHTSPSTVNDLKKTYLKRTALAEPITKWPSFIISNSTVPSLPSLQSEVISEHSFSDNSEGPSVKFLYSCPDICDLVTVSEITEGEPLPHLLDDYNYFEDFCGTSALQILLGAFTSFNCLDYKYCEVTDCIIAMFFNSSDSKGLWRERWRGVVPNPVCLQDFFDHVLEENYDWFQDEERKHDEKVDMKSRSESLNFIDEIHSKCCLNNMDVAADLLMEGSLKHDELVRIEEESEQTEVTSKASTKKVEPKKAAIATPISSVMIIPKVFTGYDIGDRRVEVFGNISQYFAEDGTKVTTNYFMMVPNNDEYVSLHLNINKRTDEVWVHKLLGERGKLSEVSESFRVNCNNNLMINLLKQTRLINVKPPSMNVDTSGPKVAILSQAPIEEYSYIEPYHAVNITWPNGLFIETVCEENSTKISHIKQTYITPPNNLNEETRCISWNGEIISFKCTGEIEVFCPDSTIIKLIDYKKQEIKKVTEEGLLSSPVSAPKVKSSEAKPPKGNKKSPHEITEETEKVEEPRELELIIDQFEITHSNGLMQKQLAGNVIIDVRNFLIRTATDFNLGEVFSRRNDGTNFIFNKDGVLITMFPDGSRIITHAIIEKEEIYPEWTEEERQCLMKPFDSESETHSIPSYGTQSETGDSVNKSIKGNSGKVLNDEGYISVRLVFTVEHPNFATVTLDRESGKVDIDSPNGSTVSMLSDKQIDMKLSAATNLHFDGKMLHVYMENCDDCRGFLTADICISKGNVSTDEDVKQPEYWMTLTDTDKKMVVVDNEGGILVDTKSDGGPEQDFPQDEPTEQAKHRSVCNEEIDTMRRKFFVLRRDMTCSELVHNVNVELYKNRCRWHPWCSIRRHETFGDHRSLLSILRPVPVTESEKWLVDSKLSDKPKYLKYKDLQPACSKGFYHWMRPYDRFKAAGWVPENVLPAGQPKAFILRTLEHQWPQSPHLRGGKELVAAILKYRQILDTQMKVVLENPFRDIREEPAVRMDAALQALAERIYKELKVRLSDDIATRKRPTITTDPLPVKEDIGEVSPVASSTTVRRVDSVAAPSEALRRYWHCRAEENKEQEFYQYLLRSGEVPGYFRNILGGAIWWEVNNRATVSVTEAELKKYKCPYDA